MLDAQHIVLFKSVIIVKKYSATTRYSKAFLIDTISRSAIRKRIYSKSLYYELPVRLPKQCPYLGFMQTYKAGP